MPFPDYVPQFDDESQPTHYRNVLGVPIRKRVVIGLMTVLVLFLIIVGALCYATIKTGDDRKDDHEVTVLSYIPIERSVNLSVDPCENFYEFSCGLWSENELVEEQQEYNVSPFSILQNAVDERKKSIFVDAQVSRDLPRTVNDAIKFYKTCVSLSSKDVIEIDYLLEYFAHAFGGWPILNPPKWDESKFDWVKVSAYLLETADIETIVKIQTIDDELDSSRKMLYLSPPYFEEVRLTSFSADLVLHTSLDCLNHSDVQISDVTESIQGIQDTEEKWMNYFEKKLVRYQNRTRMTIKELKNKTPHFDWLHYIHLVFNNTWNKIGGGLSEEDEIYVGNFEFLDTAMMKFEKEQFSKFELANLFGWFVVKKIWYIIPGAIRKTSDFYDESEKEREDTAKLQCFGAIEDLYSKELDYLYIQNMSYPGVAEDGNILFNSIRSSLFELIDRSDWLDGKTEHSAIKKLTAMKSTLGYQNFLKSKSEFEEFNEDFPSFSSCVMQTYFEIKTHSMFSGIYQLTYNNVTNAVSPRPFTHVGAYYLPQFNRLTLPLSIFNPPFYQHKGPWYLNFGAIGSILGHEMMHGFDNLGKGFDEIGNLKNWWSNNTMKRYKKHSDCFNDQYAAFKGKNGSESENKTLNEDIADSEGLHVAYLAYKKWIKDNGVDQPYMLKEKEYSPEQMFFIAFGSLWCSKIDSASSILSHSNNIIRTIGAVSNSVEFSQVFNCPIGSPMNPETKCNIW